MESKVIVRKEIGRRLRIARENAGLTQQQSAKLVQLHRPTLTEIEQGNRKVSAEELSSFSSVYDVSISWIVGEADELEFTPEIQLAARGLSRLKEEDLKNVLNLIKSIPPKNKT